MRDRGDRWLIFSQRNQWPVPPISEHWSYGAGSKVFPIHPATICLAQIQITIDWRSLSDTPRVSKTAHFPPKWSKLYLPTPRTAIKRLFRPFSGAFSFLRPNSDFPYFKLRLLSRESSVLQRGVLSLIPQMFKCKQFCHKNNLFSYSLIQLWHLHSGIPEF